nr:zinc finger, CCHC-type [Tanacetum cinerariifolium]
MKREAAERAFEAQAEKDRTLMRLKELRFLATSTKDLDDVDAYWIKNQKRLIRNKMKNDLGAEDDEDEDGCDAALETLPVNMKAGTYVTNVIAIVLRKFYGDIVVWEGIHDNRGYSGDSEFKGTEGTKEETSDGLYVRGRSDHSSKAHSVGSSRFKIMGETGKLQCFIFHSEGHLKRDCPLKKSSGFVKKGKRDQDSDSSEDEGNAYFGDALVVVENDEMTELGAQGNREAEVFQISNDDVAVA